MRSPKSPALAVARPPRPRWVGAGECARRAGVAPSTVSAALSSWGRCGVGLAYLVRRGGVVRVKPQALRDWIAAGCPTGPNREPTPRHYAPRAGRR